MAGLRCSGPASDRPPKGHGRERNRDGQEHGAGNKTTRGAHAGNVGMQKPQTEGGAAEIRRLATQMSPPPTWRGRIVIGGSSPVAFLDVGCSGTGPSLRRPAPHVPCGPRGDFEGRSASMLGASGHFLMDHGWPAHRQVCSDKRWWSHGHAKLAYRLEIASNEYSPQIHGFRRSPGRDDVGMWMQQVARRNWGGAGCLCCCEQRLGHGCDRACENGPAPE